MVIILFFSYPLFLQVIAEAPPGQTLFVVNFDYNNVTEQQMRDFFAKYGPVVEFHRVSSSLFLILLLRNALHL